MTFLFMLMAQSYYSPGYFESANALAKEYNLDFTITKELSSVLIGQEIELLRAFNDAKVAFIELGKRDVINNFTKVYGVEKFIGRRNHECMMQTTYNGVTDMMEFDICKIAKTSEQIKILRELANDFMNLVTDKNAMQ